MKAFISIFMLTLFSQLAFADRCTLTVIAESGLSLRKEPSLKSEKIDVAKFGETVFSKNGYCNYDYTKFTDNLIEIDGKKGFWIEVKYKENWGFMFSGYLLIGDFFPYSRVDTIDNVILDEIFIYRDEGNQKIDSFNYQLYTPKLNWYGIEINDSSTSITKVIIKPIYNNERWNKNNRSKCNVFLQIQNEEKYEFIFGTKEELLKTKLKSNYHQSCDGKLGVFLYPEQYHYMAYDRKGYHFRAHEIITKDISRKEGFRREYTLSLNINGNEIEIINKKIALSLNSTASGNATIQNPKLMWSGDLNDDRYLDFIFEAQPVTNQCGGGPYLRFLFSNNSEKEGLTYKTNNEFTNIDNLEKK